MKLSQYTIISLYIASKAALSNSVYIHVHNNLMIQAHGMSKVNSLHGEIGNVTCF